MNNEAFTEKHSTGLIITATDLLWIYDQILRRFFRKYEWISSYNKYALVRNGMSKKSEILIPFICLHYIPRAGIFGISQ